MAKRVGVEALEFFNKKADKLLGLSFTKTIFSQQTGLEISLEKDGPLFFSETLKRSNAMVGLNIAN